MKRHVRPLAALLLAACCATAVAAEDQAPPPQPRLVPGPLVLAPVEPDEAAGLWRAARWGMTVDEVLRAFPGEAVKLDKPLELADGNVVAVGIDDHAVAGHALRVRFVFSGGKLALVSLRTPPGTKAPAAAYDELQRHLLSRLGKADYAVKEDPFVEQRQTRWTRPGAVVDLKAVPGIVVVMYSEPPKAGK